MKVSTQDMEEALQFLVDTDVDYARCEALYKGLLEQSKTVKALAFNQSCESSDKKRENAALVSQVYQDHLNKVEVSSVDYFTLRAQRNTKLTIIDCWRSLNSAKSKGVI